MANTVACCAVADAIMAGSEPKALSTLAAKRIRLAIPLSHLMEDLDQEVAADFAHAIATLRKAGIHIEDHDYRELREIPTINAKGGIVVVEALAQHRKQLETSADAYDPRVSRRIQAGIQIPAADFVEIVAARKRLIEENARLMASFDALVLPTVPNSPPPISALARDEDYMRLNGRSLRNTSVGNFLDQCSISLPMHVQNQAPTGLMMMAPHGRDQHLFAVAAAIEAVLAPIRQG
jgi:aspartyl-tRNA(Asn)/glutamyl-tRNA(Gln) amidotransferase subunit A